MKLFYFVLNDTEKLDAILTGFIDKGIKDATIIESKGMLRLLNCTHCGEDIPFLHTVRMFVKPEWKTSNLILTTLRDEQVPLAIEAIENCIGDLNNKDTGVVFTVPIDFVKGFHNDGE
jgi:hypothetical protein